MKHLFDIRYNKATIQVEVTGSNNGHTEYLVHLPDGDMHLQHTEDDEGAGRWIDAQTNQETELSSEVGQLIELYNVQHSS
jgi:hypothetical protein